MNWTKSAVFFTIYCFAFYIDRTNGSVNSFFRNYWMHYNRYIPITQNSTNGVLLDTIYPVENSSQIGPMIDPNMGPRLYSARHMFIISSLL